MWKGCSINICKRHCKDWKPNESKSYMAMFSNLILHWCEHHVYELFKLKATSHINPIGSNLLAIARNNAWTKMVKASLWLIHQTNVKHCSMM